MPKLNRSWCDFFGLPDQCHIAIWKDNKAADITAPDYRGIVFPTSGLYPAETLHAFRAWHAYVLDTHLVTRSRIEEHVARMYNDPYQRSFLWNPIDVYRRVYPRYDDKYLMGARDWLLLPSPSDRFDPLTFDGARVARGEPAAQPAQGLCPECGERGEYIHCMTVCSKHGPYN